MKTKIQFFLISSVIFFGLVLDSHAAPPPNIRPFSPRVQAMGNSFVGLADDSMALYYNPAGLRQPVKHGVDPGNGIFTLMGVGARVNTDVIDLYNAFKDIGNEGDPIDRLSYYDKVNRKNVSIGFMADLPPLVTYVGNGWGFGFNTVSVDFALGVYEKITPVINVYGAVSTSARFGYSYPTEFLGKPLFIGATVKYQAISYANRSGNNPIDVGFFAGDLTNNAKDILYAGHGPGLDFGALWKFTESIDWGLSLVNAPAFLIPVNVQGIGGKEVKFLAPIVTTGIAYHPSWLMQILKKSFVGNIITSVNLLADYEVNFDGSWSFWKGWHFGMETGLFGKTGSWSLLYLRGGINQGYFTFGFGLDFFIAKLDYAYYQQEMGPAPGSLPDASHNISFKFEW